MYKKEYQTGEDECRVGTRVGLAIATKERSTAYVIWMQNLPQVDYTEEA